MLTSTGERLWSGHVKRVGGSLLVALMVAGCATTGANLTPEEQALRQDAQVFNETVLGGAATGAMVGGLGCALLGGGLEDCVLAAAGGAALGSVAGYITATEQRAAKEQVRQIDVVTNDVVAENEKIKAVVARAENVLKGNRAEVQKLRELVAAEKAKASEIEALRARMRANSAILNDLVSNLKKKRDQYNEVADNIEAKGQDTAKLRQAVKDMESQIALLIEYRAALEEELKVEVMG